jgi:hypothetical protein
MIRPVQAGDQARDQGVQAGLDAVERDAARPPLVQNRFAASGARSASAR